ncbi:tripartite tricarboxylate transporter substrate binding protein [Xanthobacter sediminis]
MRVIFAAAVALSAWTIPCIQTHAEVPEYPTRPVEFILPWGAGGGSDQTARELSKLLEDHLKVSFPVVNVPGGTGNAGMAKMLSGPADGYSLSLLAWDTFALLASRPPKWKMSDFINLGIVIQLPSGFYVAQDSEFKTWADVEKAAKASPGKLRVAISGFGSPDDLTIRALNKSGVSLKAVPYAEPGERYSALLGGHVDLLYSPIGNIGNFVSGKQMRPVLFFGSEPIDGFEDTPNAKDVGYNISLPQRRALIIKAGTPPEIVKKLSDAVAVAVATPEYAEFLKKQLASPNSYVPTQAAAAVMENDLKIMNSMAADK